MSDPHYLLILVIWAIWETYWIISALGTKRAARKEPLLLRAPTFIGLVLAVCLLLAPNWFGSFMDQRFAEQTDAVYLLGLAVLVCGVVFAFWARHTLGSNWSGRVSIKKGHELVTAGPYRLVRHPIYTGALLGFAGTALALGHVGGIFAVVIMVLVFARKIHVEEEVLDQHFGQRYADYRKTAKTLIPLIW